MAAFAAPPEGKGGGKGGGGGDSGGDPPPETFVPAIAYFEEGRKSKDLKLANRSGDVACLVASTPTGSPKLRGFAYDAANKHLAYSVSETAIYVVGWDLDPCDVGTPIHTIPLSSGNHIETMDFSPNGNLLVWREEDYDYAGPATAGIIHIYDLGTRSVRELPLRGWAAGEPRFSPDFARSNEVIFVGGGADGSLGTYASLYAYKIDSGVSPGTNPRKLLDGAPYNFDHIYSVSNQGGIGDPSVVLGNHLTGELLKVSIDTGSVAAIADGNEPAYSCDNSELIYRYGTGGRRSEVRITSADGSSTEVWSKADLRFFDWFCP